MRRYDRSCKTWKLAGLGTCTRLISTPISNKRLFPLAVTLSIYDFHFRQVIELLWNETRRQVKGKKFQICRLEKSNHRRRRPQNG